MTESPMLSRLAVIGFGWSCLLLADQAARPRVQTTSTERMDFPSGGLLQLETSMGQLWI
jgi:hypothetical protein